MFARTLGTLKVVGIGLFLTGGFRLILQPVFGEVDAPVLVDATGVPFDFGLAGPSITAVVGVAVAALAYLVGGLTQTRRLEALAGLIMLVAATLLAAPFVLQQVTGDVALYVLALAMATLAIEARGSRRLILVGAAVAAGVQGFALAGWHSAPTPLLLDFSAAATGLLWLVAAALALADGARATLDPQPASPERHGALGVAG